VGTQKQTGKIENGTEGQWNDWIEGEEGAKMGKARTPGFH